MTRPAIILLTVAFLVAGAAAAHAQETTPPATTPLATPATTTPVPATTTTTPAPTSVSASTTVVPTAGDAAASTPPVVATATPSTTSTPAAVAPAPGAMVAAAETGLLAITTVGGFVMGASNPGTTVQGSTLVAITDLRLLTAPTWISTVQMTDFVGTRTGRIIPAGAAVYASTSIGCSTSPGPRTLAATPVVVQTARISPCPTEWTATIHVSIPPDAVADTYRASVTHSVA
nr:hypothetical protein JVH1_1041 [Rhodococcus sp. JVH1]